MHSSREMCFQTTTDEDEAVDLLAKLWTFSRSDYEFIQTNRQRVYAPIAIKRMPYPAKGSEIYVSKLPGNLYEDELVPVLESVAPLYKFRLMLDFQYNNRGFAFATYFNKEDADAAVLKLRNFEIRPGLSITVLKSVDNRSLFIGNLPLYVTKLDLLKLLLQYVDGVVSIIMQSHYIHPHLNRGYAFVEFREHKLAAYAWNIFTPGQNKLVAWGQALYVDWADPVPEVDPRVMAKVCNLYLKNLPMEYTSDDLRTKLANVVGDQVLTKVHQIKNFAFVHFVNRQSAEVALNKLSGLMLTDSQGFEHVVEVEWAKPRCFRKKLRSRHRNSCRSVPSKKRNMLFRLTTQTRAPVNWIMDSGHSTYASEVSVSSSSGRR